jgi:hypothetical protein
VRHRNYEVKCYIIIVIASKASETARSAGREGGREKKGERE